MSVQFVRVSNGLQEEIIRAEDIVKVYKAEGATGTDIVYEFVRLHPPKFAPQISQFREEYPTTEERDHAFYDIVCALCGELQLPMCRYWREEKAKKEAKLA